MPRSTYAWVRRPIGDDEVVYSCGMHLLGHRDIEVVGASTVESLELIDGFALYVLIDRPGGSLRPGNTFALSQEAPTVRIAKSPCDRYAVDDFFFNPQGYWRLVRPADGVL